MVRLFYKDMKAHERSYKNLRADEAVNDLILGAKVNAYNGFKEKVNKSALDIAENYGNFLKSLEVKNLDLKNKKSIEEKTLEKNAKEGKFLLMTPQEVKENILMGKEDKPRRDLKEKKQTLTLTQYGSKKSGSPAKKRGAKSKIEKENILMGSQDKDIKGALYPKSQSASQKLLNEMTAEDLAKNAIKEALIELKKEEKKKKTK
jgi:hypothetical protein